MSASENRDSHPGTWTVRVAQRPAIVCPTWCTVPVEQPRDDLEDAGGFVTPTTATGTCWGGV